MKMELSTRWRAHPLFFAAMAALVAVAAGGVLEVWRQARGRRGVESDYSRLRIEWLTPQSRSEMVEAAGAALARAREELRLARAEWVGPTPATEGGRDRLGAYAELARFVECNRAEATAAGVALAKDECFGFAQHAHEPPAEAEVKPVVTQLQVLERVLSALWAAAPERLFGVWREDPKPENAARDGGEWCALDLVRSVRVPGVVHSRVVRVAFAGTPACLRSFLNRLGAEPSLVVREVAVLAAEEKGGSAERATALGARRRRFTVTLEAVTVAGGTGSVAGDPAGRPAVWCSPTASAAGGDEFTVFSAAALEYREDQRQWVRLAGEARPAGDTFGVELVAVRSTPYRWRLVGHVGAGAAAAAMIEDVVAHRSVLLRTGDRDVASGLTLTGLEFSVAVNGGRMVQASLAEAGEIVPVVLSTAGGSGPTRLVAVLRMHGVEETLEAAEGATVNTAGVGFTIGALSADPMTAEVTRAATAGKPAEARRLRATAK